jgi:hypothetical protein
MKDLLQYMAEQLVSKPDEVTVAESEVGGETRLELRVGQGDMGKVIGRGGSVAKDLRYIVRAAAPQGKRVNVEIIDR